MIRLVPVAMSFVLLLAWPAGADAIGFDEARHLLVRTGFEASPAAIERLKPLRYDDAVARLLKETRSEALTPPPAWMDQPRATDRERLHAQAWELKGWWFREMATTPAPLTERMTLFWHDHFTSELRKVRSPQLMYRQNALLRRHALGNFRTLLREIAQDPAMMIYLDLASNRKGQPNENFARELFELFTLGKGNYTERDVKEAARAFTGWRINPETGLAEFNDKQHDDGVKQVLGGTGKLTGEQVINLALRDSRTSEFIVRKLWREFVSNRPDPAQVQRIAAEFRKNYEIKPVLRALLQTEAFRAAKQRGRMIKSPVELLAGTVRQFGIPVGDGRELARASRLLGQDLFDPPNVKGWSMGTDWITTATLLTRQQMPGRLLRGMEMGEGGTTAVQAGDLSSAQLAALLLPVPAVDPLPTGLSSFELAAHLVRDPAYQLK